MHTYSRGVYACTGYDGEKPVQTVYGELMGEKYAINVILSQAL